MAAKTPSWMVAAPWSVTRPTNRPLAVGDMMGHKPLLLGPEQDMAWLWPIRGDVRFALPYLIPQSEGVTSRLIFAWAFMAPLVEIAQVSVAAPLAVIQHIAPRYNPLTDVVIPQQTVVTWKLHAFFRSAAVPCVFEGQLCLVMRIQTDQVAVAPLDTPVHPFSDALTAFPGC